MKSLIKYSPKFPIQDFFIIPKFITVEEQKKLVEEIDIKFKGIPYENNHFDSVIIIIGNE